MDPKRSRARRRAYVRASELAEMGTCERRVLFEHHYGKRRSRAQVEAIDRGVRAHERFYREALAATSAAVRRRGRCFIGLEPTCKRFATQTERRSPRQSSRLWREAVVSRAAAGGS
jgi:hypothetical protein